MELSATLIGNGVQILLVPVLAGGLWWITASAQYIGESYRNRWWENLIMLFVFSLALWGSIEIVTELVASAKVIFR